MLRYKQEGSTPTVKRPLKRMSSKASHQKKNSTQQLLLSFQSSIFRDLYWSSISTDASHTPHSRVFPICHTNRKREAHLSVETKWNLFLQYSCKHAFKSHRNTAQKISISFFCLGNFMKDELFWTGYLKLVAKHVYIQCFSFIWKVCGKHSQLLPGKLFHECCSF